MLYNLKYRKTHYDTLARRCTEDHNFIGTEKECAEFIKNLPVHCFVVDKQLTFTEQDIEWHARRSKVSRNPYLKTFSQHKLWKQCWVETHKESK